MAVVVPPEVRRLRSSPLQESASQRRRRPATSRLLPRATSTGKAKAAYSNVGYLLVQFPLLGYRLLESRRVGRAFGLTWRRSPSFTPPSRSSPSRTRELRLEQRTSPAKSTRVAAGPRTRKGGIGLAASAIRRVATSEVSEGRQPDSPRVERSLACSEPGSEDCRSRRWVTLGQAGEGVGGEAGHPSTREGLGSGGA